jgi:hypothetical protein
LSMLAKSIGVQPSRRWRTDIVDGVKALASGRPLEALATSKAERANPVVEHPGMSDEALARSGNPIVPANRSRQSHLKGRLSIRHCENNRYSSNIKASTQNCKVHVQWCPWGGQRAAKGIPGNIPWIPRGCGSLQHRMLFPRSPV